jgi:dihydrolipoamide dehydrogenase
MKVRQVDVAVIGAGTAGLNARREAEKRGAQALLIESGPYGTTCARVGCMPSKLLIAAADVAHEIARAPQFGIHVTGPARIDGRAVLERVRRERDRFVGFVVESTESVPEELRLRGRARFVAPTTLEVDDHTRVEARAVVIAAGSSPTIPPALEGIRDELLTNENVFDLEDLPESVAIVGTGVIALELGQALHRLGVRTVIFGRSAHLSPVTDPEVQRSIREVLGAELTLRLRADYRVDRDPAGGYRIAWRTADGAAGEERVERVLAASGRRPNVAALQLEKTGLALGRDGVPLFDRRTMQCGDAPIFLAGDVSGDRPVLHEAADEGRIAGHNAGAWPDVRAQMRRTPLAIVFTHPEIALVGERFADLDLDAVEIGEVFYEEQGRAQVMGLNAGRVRIYARRDCGTLIGAEMFGPRVEHTAHLLAWAVQQQQSVECTLENPIYHPVIEEGIQTALRDLASQLKMMPPVHPEDLECGPGN